MDQNKLYNALLKTQSEQHKIREEQQSEAEARNHQVERPYARTAKPNEPQQVDVKQPVTVYDTSASLTLINNPNPWSKAELKARKIIYPSMANKAILNAYREVRIKLRNLSEGNNFSVMVTSLGTSKQSADSMLLSAYNLAASFALDAQSSALLIDCDPYQDRLHNLVSTNISKGVTDYLENRALKASDIIYPSGIDRLSVVPAGTIDVSVVELFSSTRMKSLMEELKERYPDRYIVVNAPPFRVSTEARILVKYADHAIMTVPFGELTAEDIAASIEALDSDKFAGLIYQE